MASPYDMRGMFGLGGQPIPAMQQAAPEPFLWGAAGSKYSPEQVEQMRAMAQAEMQDATSGAPVAHWLQGLNRSLGAVTGGLRMRKADKAGAEIAAESDAVTQALLANPTRDSVLGAIASGKLSKGGMAVAEILAEGFKPPKPNAPPEIIELASIANDPMQPDHIRRVAADRVRAINDPFTVLQLKNGTMAGPVSLVQQAIQGGGGQASGVPQTTAPPAEAIAELKANPDTADEFDAEFGQGASARFLAATNTGGPAATPGQFPVVR